MSYESHKESARERQAEQSRTGRDIGDIPPVDDPTRRAESDRSFRFFLETYFPEVFSLAWSDDHLKVIKKLESAVIRGELFALAMPRGSGKTSISIRGALWAMLIGRRKFVALIGAERESAVEMMLTMKQELETNAMLAADYPEVCFPIRAMESISQRAKGQLCNGERTHIGWKEKQIIFPTITGSASSGAIVRTAGITGKIRGMQYQRLDGESARPDLVIVDDPQTDESARSPSQNTTRARLLSGAILGLAGPGKKIAGVMPCTVIAQDDMADRILNKKKYPQWRGERCKMLYSFPKAEKLWDQYSEIYMEGLRAEDHNKSANEFYTEHREAMDAGALAGWPARFYPDEISAIQHAINLKTRDPSGFFAEYQNEPLAELVGADNQLNDKTLEDKIGGLAQRVVPLACQSVTAFIDVQKNSLWWIVVAWDEGFGGQILDYGAWPEQGLTYYTNRTIKKTLGGLTPGGDMESQIFAGLESLTDHLTSQNYKNEAGSPMHISRMAVDANWGPSTNVVYQWCRETRHKALILPSHGRGVGASNKPLNEYEKKPGDQPGHFWRITAASKRAARYLLIDTNYWKTFITDRLKTTKGGKGCLTIYKATATRHRMLIEQLTSEYSIATSGRGRQVDEYKLHTGRDNHLWDCLVGAAVCASMLGVHTLGHIQQNVRKKRTKRKATYFD